MSADYNVYLTISVDKPFLSDAGCLLRQYVHRLSGKLEDHTLWDVDASIRRG